MEVRVTFSHFVRKYSQNTAIFLLIIAVLTTQYVFANEGDEFDHDYEEFNVQPGGQPHSKERELDGVVCKFTYKAQGGTNEKWIITLSRIQGFGKYYCSVTRPDRKSYLFFMHFSLEIQGAAFADGEPLVHGNNGAELKPHEYTASGDHKSGTVTSVEGKFQSQLTSVVIRANKPKDEL